jgi:hypothetical protein
MSAISPIQSVRLVIDTPIPVKVRGADTFSRDHSEMALTRISGGKAMHTSAGWTTKPETINEEGRHLLYSELLPMPGTWGADLEESSIGRTSGRPGSDTGGGLLAAYTNPFPAGGSPTYAVGSGHLANSVDHPEPFDRWFVSTSDHNPDTPIRLSFELPPKVVSDGAFMMVYHAGPTGCRNGVAGSGRYCSQFMLDGSAVLWELNEAGAAWFEHGRFRWTPGNPTGKEYTISIYPRAEYKNDEWVGDSIEYFGGQPLIPQLIGVAMRLIAKTVGAQISASAAGDGVTVITSDYSATVEQPVASKAMIEVRRDMPCKVHISQIEQPAGTFEDREFVIPNGDIDATADFPLTIRSYGYTPASSTHDISLYGYNETTSAWEACTVVTGSTVSTAQGVQKQVVLIPGATRYKFRHVLTPNSAGRAPTFRKDEYYRPGKYGTDTIEPTTINESFGVRFESIVIQDGGPDPTQEVCNITIIEDGSLSDPFDLRRNIPIRVEADVLDPRDMTTVATCILFNGRVVAAPSRPITLNMHDEQVGSAFQRDLMCVGEGFRLTRPLTQFSLNLINQKATDAIKLLIGETGIPDSGAESMLDVPAWNMALLPFDDSDPWFLESMSDVIGPVRTIVDDWLGAMLQYDTAAVPALGDPDTHLSGMFRIKEIPQGTETAIAHFVEVTPKFTGQSGKKDQINYKSFIDPNATSLNRAPYLLVEHMTLTEDVIPPEMNEIIVTGVGHLGADALFATSSDNEAKYEVIVRNYRSAQFFDDQTIEPDPESPDYLGEVVTTYECNTGYCTQQIVDNVAKRRMRMGGQGYYTKSFQCPFWPVWNYADTLQARPRRLMYADVVDYTKQGGTAAKYVVTKSLVAITKEDGGVRKARYILGIESPRPDVATINRS